MRRNTSKRSTRKLGTRKSAREKNTSRSPIKKMLIKKIVSYYDTLSTSRSPSPSKNQTLYQNTSRVSELSKSPSRRSFKRSLISPKKTNYEREHNIEYYQEEMHRNTKLDKLQSLMKTELEKVREGILGSEAEKMEKLKKSVTGYPTFMHEKEDKLKHKEWQRKGTEEFDELEDNLAEQGLEAAEDVPYFGSSTIQIVETEYNQTHTEDLGDQLKERVDHAEDNPVSEAESSVEGEEDVQFVRGNTSAEKRHYLRTIGDTDQFTDDIFDNEHLYHLNTKKNYVHPSSSDADLYDFHQRKSKEIRRLQYVASLEKRKRKKKPKPQTPPRVAPPKPKTPSPSPPPPEPVELIYPVWVVHKKKPYPAELKMTLPPGTEINNEGLLEVREGDFVEVEVNPINPKTWYGEDLKLPEGMVLPDLRAKFSGNTVVPLPSDGDCDFVVVDDTPFDLSSLPKNMKNHPSFRVPKRYPIMTNLRAIDIPNPLDESNCDVYDVDPLNDYFGRGNFKLLDGDGNHLKWAKGILSDNENQLSYVFVRRDSENKIWLRQSIPNSNSEESEGQTYEFETSLETFIIEELLYFPSLKAYVTKLTLKEEYIGNERVKIPRQIYFIEGQECLENIELLHGIYAFCRCEDGEDYYGTIEYDGDFGIKLNLDKSKHDYEDDYVRVVVDEPELLENYRNITDIWDKIEFMNNFRVGGPWIVQKDTEDASTGYHFEPETSEIGIGTIPPKMDSQCIGTDTPKMESQCVGTTPPKMVSQGVDAVNEPQGLRLDNLEFGIVDGSGRRLRIMVRNEEDNSVKDTQVETIEFYKSSGRPGESKNLGVTIGESEIFENEENGLQEGLTPVDIVENIQEDQENFEGEVDVEFENDNDELGLSQVNVKFSMDKEFRDKHVADLLPEQRELYNEDFAKKILKDRYGEFVKFYESLPGNVGFDRALNMFKSLLKE